MYFYDVSLHPIDVAKLILVSVAVWLLFLGNERVHHPKSAEYILYLFLSKEQRQVIPGDLAEEYATIVRPRFGRLAADCWYWSQAIRSLPPVVSMWLRRIATWGSLTAFARHFLKWF